MHGKKFRIFISRGIKKKSEIRIDHFIISNEHNWRGKIRFIFIFLLSLFFIQFKCFATVYNFLMINISRNTNDNIIGCVIVLNKLFDILLSDILKIFSDP